MIQELTTIEPDAVVEKTNELTYKINRIQQALNDITKGQDSLRHMDRGDTDEVVGVLTGVLEDLIKSLQEI